METSSRIDVPFFVSIHKWRKRSSIGGHCLNESFTLKEDLYPRKFNPLRRCIRNKDTIEHIYQKYFKPGNSDIWFREMKRFVNYEWLREMGKWQSV